MPVNVAIPCELVVAVASSRPSQVETRTVALATGLPLSSVVTQASAFSRPSLKCTPRLVTRAEVRTNMGCALPARFSSNELPSLSDSISTT